MSGTDRSSEESLPGALRRAEGEARPRAAFRAALRRAFVEGALIARAPGPEGVEDPGEGGMEAEVRRGPGPVAGPRRRVPAAAAAILLGGVALAVVARRGGDDGGAPPVAVAPTAPIPAAKAVPATPPEAAHGAADAALARAVAEAEARARAVPALAASSFRSRVYADRIVVVAAAGGAGDGGAAEATDAPLARLCAVVADAEDRLDRAFPPAAGTAPARATVVVAPSREAFVAAVAPRVAPMAVPERIAAFALAPEGVLLVSPLALDPESTACEDMDVAHEAVHARLHARASAGAHLPLWIAEGLADVVAAEGAGQDLVAAWRPMFRSLRHHRIRPFAPADVFALGDYGEMVQHARERSLCDERVDMFVPVFHAEADTLLLYLLGDPRPGDRARLEALVERCLRGDAPAPEAVAAALGFEDGGALLAARDAALGLLPDGDDTR